MHSRVGCAQSIQHERAYITQQIVPAMEQHCIRTMPSQSSLGLVVNNAFSGCSSAGTTLTTVIQDDDINDACIIFENCNILSCFTWNCVYMCLHDKLLNVL